MPVDSQLRTLKVDIPSQPESLVELSLMLADDHVNLQAMSTLIAADMALASAVLKAVNSSLYGLKGRVQSVKQAITYLGMKEVASVTFAMGLQAVFPLAPELTPIWERANVRGVLMGRLGKALDIDPWAAHSAGLFEECGKAVLLRHAPERYRGLLRQAEESDAELLLLEHAEFGVSHDALGAALCESWGLSPLSVESVRHHVVVNATGELPAQVPMQRRAICVLSALAQSLMSEGASLEALTAKLAPQADLDPMTLLRGAQGVQKQLENAMARHEAA
ncbi:MAG: HDOD domain-containing protein [Rhizobacter sp.]|nr:HDOD domain-containing protein [Rhizobacter sp.]